MRNTHREQMFSALPPNSDVARCARHFAFVPTRDSCTAANGRTRRAAGSPSPEGWFRVSLRSQIAACQQSRTMRLQRTRDKTIRRQIEKLAQHWSWVPPLFAFFVLTYRRICKIAGEGKSIPYD
jgi:hypothetical protein